MSKAILSRIDFGLTFFVTVLMTIGLTAVYSATYSSSGSDYFDRQLIFAISGLILMIGVTFVPFRFLERMAYPFYGFSILLLVLVEFFGVRGFGAERWLSIAGIKVQPSEIAKLATIMAVARYTCNREVTVNHWKHFLVVTAFIVLPFLLIIRQPDLGTSLVYVAMAIPLMFWAGLNWFALFLILSPLVTVFTSFNWIALAAWLLLIGAFLYITRKRWTLIVLILALHFGVGLLTPQLWDQLQPYQKSRIITFINPEQDPRGAGYQIIQSQVAIGSGGVWGKGFKNGTQTHLKFLPAQHTDFIFSVIGEEWGFTGVIFVLGVLLAFLLYLVHLGTQVKSAFASMTIIGVTSVLFFHIFVNIGMTVGVAPVTGLPLPFFSYGGSFLLSTLLMIGVIQNFAYHRFLV